MRCKSIFHLNWGVKSKSNCSKIIEREERNADRICFASAGSSSTCSPEASSAAVSTSSMETAMSECYSVFTQQVGDATTWYANNAKVHWCILIKLSTQVKAWKSSLVWLCTGVSNMPNSRPTHASNLALIWASTLELGTSRLGNSVRLRLKLR